MAAAVLWLAAPTWCGLSSATAAEGAVFGGPTGGTDIRNAYTPPVSGFYGNFVALYAGATDTHGDTGQTVPVHVNTNLGAGAAGLLYVYPFKVFGGALDSFVQEAISYGKGTIGSRGGYASGFSDTYLELLGWSRYIGPIFGEGHTPSDQGSNKPRLPYGLTLKVAYSMILPTGDYNRNYLLPQGHNDFFFIPNIAATYLTQPNFLGDGIEFSVHVFADLAARNRKTDYFTGPVIDTDFAISDRLGRYQFGLTGFFAQQVQRDKAGGREVQPNGKRLVSFDLGPVLAYDIPEWQSTVKIKYQAPIDYHNSLGVQRLVISYSVKF